MLREVLILLKDGTTQEIRVDLSPLIEIIKHLPRRLIEKPQQIQLRDHELRILQLLTSNPLRGLLDLNPASGHDPQGILNPPADPVKEIL